MPGEPFDEIMIVNPCGDKGGRRMKLYPVRGPLGHFAEAPDQISYYAEAPETMGYFQEVPEAVGYYAEAPEMMGYYAEAPEVGYVYEAPETVGYYAEAPEFAEASGEMGYVSESPAETMGYYGAEPEVGYYGAEPEVGYYGERPDEVGYMAEDGAPMEGYVRETESRFSPRVVPMDNVNGFEGFVTPKSVNPTCEKLRPAERLIERSPDWFKPLW
jgi:hypothetical protein